MYDKIIFSLIKFLYWINRFIDGKKAKTIKSKKTALRLKRNYAILIKISKRLNV